MMHDAEVGGTVRRTGPLVAGAVVLTVACGPVAEPAARPTATEPRSPASGSTASPPSSVAHASPVVLWRSRENPQRCCLIGNGSALVGHGEMVLVADGFDGGGVTALDAATGDRAWNVELGVPTVFLGDANDHVVIVHGQYGWVGGLDPSSGDERWRVQLDRDGYGVAGVELLGSGTAVVSLTTPGEGNDRAPSVMLVDTADGNPTWRTDLDRSSEMQWFAPVVVDGQVLVQTTPDSPAAPVTNTLHALELETGRLLWETDLGGRQGFFEVPPAVIDGTVVARGLDLHGIDLASGKVSWTAPGAYPLWARPDGTLVLSVRSSLTAIHAHDGTHASTIETSGPFDPASVAPLVNGDRVIVSTRHELLAFERASADPVWRYPTDEPTAALNAAGDSVVALLQDGTIIGLTEP